MSPPTGADDAVAHEPSPHVLVVTSAGASPAAVVPVLAAIEAAGMRVRALDVGAAGGGGAGVADRVRRALLGESAERRLRREMDANPPDVAIAFDPHAALALTVARDQATTPAPVIAVIGELDPVAEWGQTDADRFLVIDAEASVALADHGVEGDRIVVVGPLGERAWADAGAQDRNAVRQRFGLGACVVCEVGGLGAELTGQLVLQLSLASGVEHLTFLFDAAGDADAGAVLRRQVPALGLKAKLFGATTDAPLLWRAAEVVIARPRPGAVARAALIGARMVLLVDDAVAGGARTAAALEARKRAVVARSPLLVSSGLDALLKAGRAPDPASDGADNVADIVWVIAGEKRAVIEERRAAARAATHDRVKAATSAATAAARTTAMPGDLEDLSGAPVAEPVGIPDEAELGRLRTEVKARIDQLTRDMMAARAAGDDWSKKASGARARGADDEARDADRHGDAERARMHALLGELGTLEGELRELERAIAAARASGVRSSPPPVEDLGGRSASSSAGAPPRRPAGPSVDDLLDQLKRSGGSAATIPPRPSAARPPPGRADDKAGVDAELEALKRKLAAQKKKP